MVWSVGITEPLPHNADYVSGSWRVSLGCKRDWNKRGDSDRMSSKNGRYLKQTQKRKKRKNMAVPVLSGVIVILLIAVAAMLLNVHNRSVYQVISHDGYTGTQEQWLASLVGEETDMNAESAYELAVRNGYIGSESEWIEALAGVSVEKVKTSPYQLACEMGFEGSLTEWLTQIADKPEKLGRSNDEEKKTEYELACEYGYTGTFIEWLVSVTHDRVFE